MHTYMGSVLLQPDTEVVLEWVLFFALSASALCMLSLVTMLIIGKWWGYRK